jgi:formylglycine-generating enzyme required for sulfatase activity
VGARAGGLLKPNDLGLFDLYGNVIEWVQDPGFVYHWPGGNQWKEDGEYPLDVRDTTRRLLRGGSFDHEPSSLRSADRRAYVPANISTTAGFRVARTYP